MRIFNPLYLLMLLLLMAVSATSVSSARPDFLNLRRKYHRHYCHYRRCLPLHSRVPFP
ncbi:apelin receptor early endogenous ligand [Gouania willdenowi]|uniref:apelin receptor early endogenous ligand n=1 Tax=Gouania willdenowi TaxID=441366 RepID=UPI001055A1C4|nr:apelin receptor early endogenous ligand [Gouania willdenowi]